MRNRFFIGLVLLLQSVALAAVFVVSPREVSIVENRALTQYPTWTWDSFRDGSYQSEFESALTDQWGLAESMKAFHAFGERQAMRVVDTVLTPQERIETRPVDITAVDVSSDDGTGQVMESARITDRPNPRPFHVSLRPLGKNLFLMTPGERLIVVHPNQTAMLNYIRAGAAWISEQAEGLQVPVYVYYIESDVDIDFVEGRMPHMALNTIKTTLPEDIKIAAYEVDSFEQYLQSFYKTDHHWNARGQYEGYVDIVHLLKGKRIAMLPIEVMVATGVRFNGYRARLLNDLDRFDDFDFLSMSLPEHEEVINGRPGTYGRKAAYIAGHIRQEAGVNHFGICGGRDHGEVRFVFPENRGKGKLLVLSDSYINPLKSYIASHFEEAVFIDLRYYTRDMGAKFSLQETVNQGDYDQVLVAGSSFFIRILPELYVKQEVGDGF